MSALDELRQRYEALEPRERTFITGGAIALAVILLFLVVVQPLREYRDGIAERVTAERALVAWMRGAVDALRQRGPARSTIDTSGSLLALADTSARAAGLSQSLRRIQQDGEDGVRARLEAASFDALILWLDNLEKRHGVSANEMSVERTDTPGLVDASLTLARNTAQ